MKDPIAVTTRKVIPQDPYQPSQLRLYGLPCKFIESPGFDVFVLAIRDNSGGKVSELADSLQGAIHELARGQKAEEVFTEVLLEEFKEKMIGIAKIRGEAEARGDVSYEVAIIYGYSYEGHCYSLPQPMILAVDKDTRQLADGCGYGSDYSIGRKARGEVGTKVHYWMWTADKLDKTLELALRQGFFEELVLARNTGDRREPQSYSAKIAMAHRGGRLVD